MASSSHILAVAVLGLLLAQPLFADIWYISPLGRDTNTGTSSDDAFLTLSRALNASSAKDTVSISPGSYNGPLNTGLTITQPITLHASSGTPVFTCASSSSLAGLIIAADTVIEGLKYISCSTSLKFTDGSAHSLTNVILDSTNTAISTSAGYKSLDLKNVQIVRGITTFGTGASGQSRIDSLTFTGCTFGGNGKFAMEIYLTNTITFDKCVFASLTLQYPYDNALYIDGGDVEITNTKFKDISCYYNSIGCGLNFNGRGGDELRMSGTTFENITKASSGAAIGLFGGKVLIQNSTFDTVSASNNGGAIYLGGSSAQLNVFSTDYTNCSALRGATVYCSIEGQYYCDGCTEENNKESESGGC